MADGSPSGDGSNGPSASGGGADGGGGWNGSILNDSDYEAANWVGNAATSVATAAVGMLGGELGGLINKAADTVLEADVATNAAADVASGGGENIALGVNERLDQFTEMVNGSNWNTWGTNSFKTDFMDVVGNPENSVHFNLTGPTGEQINAWNAVSEGMAPGSRATSWEISQIYQNGWASRTTWYFNGGVIPNPFE